MREDKWIATHITLLWDAKSRKLVRELSENEDVSEALAFSPNGSELACGNWSGSIHVWDVASGNELRHFDLPAGHVNNLLFLPGGNGIVAAYDKHGIRVFLDKPSKPFQDSRAP